MASNTLNPDDIRIIKDIISYRLSPFLETDAISFGKWIGSCIGFLEAQGRWDFRISLDDDYVNKVCQLYD
jgi:hypothetical protein